MKKPDLEKKERGFTDQYTADDNSLTVVGWHDNKAVYMASNVYDVLPVSSVSRWSRADNSKIQS